MEFNPYESPKPSTHLRRNSRSLLLRLLAIGFWLAATLPVMAFLSIVNRPEVAQRHAQSPPLSIAIHVILFALPAIGFAMLGIACWRRSGWLGFCGIAAFMPVILVTIAAFSRMWQQAG
jgi:hypothetical protein